MDTQSQTKIGQEELSALVARVASGGELDAAQAETVFTAIMQGEASPVQMSALLVGFRVRGVVAAEVAGGVRALRQAMIPVHSENPDVLVDTAGTGGGSITTFNISTAAALVAAGGGVPIAKHGNRSFSSRSGSADVLEALGVNIQLTAEQMGDVLREVGIVFMFAPLLHPAMRHVGPVRRELKISTVMNLLGPLTNPAGARRQVVGVADPDLLPLVVEAFQQLGHERALVVHGEPGLDEVSPLGPTRIALLDAGGVREEVVTPEGLGVPTSGIEGLEGGSPEENAVVIRKVLNGEMGGSARAAVVLNAAAAFFVSGRVDDLQGGVEEANKAIDSGSATETLDQLREATQAAATP